LNQIDNFYRYNPTPPTRATTTTTNNNNNNNNNMFPLLFLISAGLAIPRLFLASSFFFGGAGLTFWSQQFRVRPMHAMAMIGGGGGGDGGRVGFGAGALLVRPEDALASSYIYMLIRDRVSSS
jgi:hypothetical protein